MDFYAGYAFGCVCSWLWVRYLLPRLLPKPKPKLDHELLLLRAATVVDKMCTCDGCGKCAACRLWISIRYSE